ELNFDLSELVMLFTPLMRRCMMFLPALKSQLFADENAALIFSGIPRTVASSELIVLVTLLFIELNALNARVFAALNPFEMKFFPACTLAFTAVTTLMKILRTPIFNMSHSRCAVVVMVFHASASIVANPVTFAVTHSTMPFHRSTKNCLIDS